MVPLRTFPRHRFIGIVLVVASATGLTVHCAQGRCQLPNPLLVHDEKRVPEPARMGEYLCEYGLTSGGF